MHGGVLLWAMDERHTYEKISLNSLNTMPLSGVNAFDASHIDFRMQARPSKPCLCGRTAGQRRRIHALRFVFMFVLAALVTPNTPAPHTLTG